MDTVELVLHSLTGDPVIPKPAMERFSLMDALEGYQEGKEDTFTHWGVQYHINDIFDMVSHRHPETVKMKDVEWNVKDVSELDSARLAAADANYPLIGIREKGKVYILDGNHRLRKLYDRGAKEVQVIFITQDMLDIARVDD